MPLLPTFSNLFNLKTQFQSIIKDQGSNNILYLLLFTFFLLRFNRNFIFLIPLLLIMHKDWNKMKENEKIEVQKKNTIAQAVQAEKAAYKGHEFFGEPYLFPSKSQSSFSFDSLDLDFIKCHSIYNYRILVQMCNKFSRLFQKIHKGIVNCRNNVDLLEDLKKNILNHCHSFIYNIPHQVDIMKKYDCFLKDIEKKLDSSMEIIVKKCKSNDATCKVDKQSYFLYREKGDVKPSESTTNYNYDFFA